MDMGPPTSNNEVQRLTGRIAALSRFISKSAKKGLPFFKILRKQDYLCWSNWYRGHPVPLHIHDSPGRKFGTGTRRRGQSNTHLLCEQSLQWGRKSLCTHREDGPDLGHHREKITPYFLSYAIGVRTNTLLKQVLGKPKASGRLVKWTIELSEYDISYLLRTTIKAQALADFVSEMTGTIQEEVSEARTWLLHVDGSSTT
ncbi:UNVERIFIED_CONTAM: hypothetical protein Sradi_2384900 [Sesamum radiatum]|uniref:Uncharacterized protein n=1 Tax=Sesamum radiatum TaxID=300843 RepID=A0AAW2T6A6_SESRA